MTLPSNMEGLLRHHLQVFLNTAKHCFPDSLPPDHTGRVLVTAEVTCGLDTVVAVAPHTITLVRAPQWLVKVTVFKGPGKYYTEGEYHSTHSDLHKIFEEVRVMHKTGRLPGILPTDAPEGHQRWNALVQVPGHPHDHPNLIPATLPWE